MRRWKYFNYKIYIFRLIVEAALAVSRLHINIHVNCHYFWMLIYISSSSNINIFSSFQVTVEHSFTIIIWTRSCPLLYYKSPHTFLCMYCIHIYVWYNNIKNTLGVLGSCGDGVTSSIRYFSHVFSFLLLPGLYPSLHVHSPVKLYKRLFSCYRLLY